MMRRGELESHCQLLQCLRAPRMMGNFPLITERNAAVPALSFAVALLAMVLPARGVSSYCPMNTLRIE